MKKSIRMMIGLSALVVLTGCGTGSDDAGQSSSVNITVWHYYNGAQLDKFNQLVDEFNQTEGKEKGIVVRASSQGTVVDLETSVIDAIEGKVGSQAVPNIFAAYTDTAYMVDSMDYVADLSSYMTKDEIAEYVDSYIEEGYLNRDGKLKIFPVAKSTEVLMVNQTDWDKFSQATGADTQDLTTFEGITQTAQKYYEWTDSLTEEPNDGKAFFGRDAMANYIIMGFRQHGIEIFDVDESGKAALVFDKDVVRKLWDNYYVPYVKGYFSSSGRFRSDDIKIGNVISFVGSSSGATFFPETVSLSDEETYPIECAVYAVPVFEGQEKVAIQQGAGMVVTKATEEEERASVEFLKWFTKEENNIDFSVSSGYLPVKKAANNLDTIKKYSSTDNNVVQQVLTVAVDTVSNYDMYTTAAFENGTKARNILEYGLSDKAAADRQKVTENLSAGMTYGESTAEFLSEECFDSWYEETKAALETIMQ